MADAGLGIDLAAVLCPTAVGIICNIVHDTGLHGVLMVDTTHHDVVDTGGCFVSCATWHGVLFLQKNNDKCEKNCVMTQDERWRKMVEP